MDDGNDASQVATADQAIADDTGEASAESESDHDESDDDSDYHDAVIDSASSSSDDDEEADITLKKEYFMFNTAIGSNQPLEDRAGFYKEQVRAVVSLYCRVRCVIVCCVANTLTGCEQKPAH
jgi:hypothetical protein